MEGKNSKKVATEKAFGIVHKVPVGDTPYVRAKHLQLVDKDNEAAIVWFWKAINAGDRVESALKDMAVVMKQQNRTEEAIEAIKSFRHLCSKHAQESLNNILIDLYKKCGRFEEQIHLLKQKLHEIYCGKAFNGKTTKTARSHGKKFQISIKQETARVLSNLGWVYMQQEKYRAAEVVYQKAQLVEPDANIACNLGQCLIKMGRFDYARCVLDDVLNRRFDSSSSSQCGKTVSRAKELMREMQKFGRGNADTLPLDTNGVVSIEQEITKRLELVMNEWAPLWSRRLPIFEEISPFRNLIPC